MNYAIKRLSKKLYTILYSVMRYFCETFVSFFSEEMKPNVYLFDKIYAY
jgi:hypothetical protein